MVCCVGEPKVSLQGLEKNETFNKHLITLGHSYFREIKFIVEAIFVKMPLFKAEMSNSQC